MEPLWPAETVAGHQPCMTGNRFSAKHTGVDIMSKRTAGDPDGHFDGLFSRGNVLYYVPPDVHLRASDASTVVYAKPDKNGFRVRLAMLAGFHLLNLHMENLLVALTHELEHGVLKKLSNGGQLLLRGQRLGLMGGDPTDMGPPRALVHDHFERRVPRDWKEAQVSLALGIPVDGWGMVPVNPEGYLARCAFA